MFIGALIILVLHTQKQVLFWNLISLPTTLQSPTCWDSSKLLPIKINKFLSIPTATPESRPEYEESFLFGGPAFQALCDARPRYLIRFILRAPSESSVPAKRSTKIALAFVFAPITACQTLRHPSRSIPSIIFPVKLPSPPQPKMNFPVFWLLRPTCHSSFILRLLKFLCNRGRILYLALRNTWTWAVLFVV